MRGARRTFIGLLTGLCALAFSPALLASQSPDALEAALDDTLASLAPLGVQEAVLVVETPSGRRFTASVGVPGGNQKAQTRLFQIGSQTKWFTAAAIVLLAKDGVLTLDDPVGKYLSALEGAEDVRLRNLLTHTSGLGDAVEYLETDGAPPEGAFTFEELMFLSRLKGRAFKTGERFAYNNYGFDVLGAVIEAASGETREAFVATRILAPLKMSDVYFGETGDWPVEDAARGFYPAKGAPMEMTGPRDLSWASAAGDMIASADMMLVWLKALGDSGNAAGLTLEDFTKIHVDSTAHSAEMPEYGLGVMGRRFAGRPTWGHGGFIHGYVSYAGVDAQNGVRFVLLTSMSGDPNIPPQGLLGGVSSVIGTALQLTDYAIKTGTLEE